MTGTSTFVAEKRVAVQSYRKVLTRERVGPYDHDPELVPYLLELNAIPGCYSWASCAGHADGRGGFVWVALRYEARRVPKTLGDFGELRHFRDAVTILHPFQGSVRKIGFEFVGDDRLDTDMGLVLAYLWGLPTG